MQYSAPSDATHIREMLARLSLSQRAAAEELDVSARDMRAYCAGKTVPKVVMLALARLVDLQRRVELDSRKPGISMLTLVVDGNKINVPWYGSEPPSIEVQAKIIEAIRLKSDPYPKCPRCGCAPGTYGRLLRTKEGAIICNDCQGHIFERAPR